MNIRSVKEMGLTILASIFALFLILFAIFAPRIAELQSYSAETAGISNVQVEWLDSTGEGLVAPACGSSNAPTVRCVPNTPGGSSRALISWSYASIAEHRCSYAVVRLEQFRGGAFQQPAGVVNNVVRNCTDSYEFYDISYYYNPHRYTVWWYNTSGVLLSYQQGTFTSMNCDSIVNASCGGAAKQYAYNESFPSGSYCGNGSVSSAPSNPAPGGSTSWTCNGSGGGSNVSCTASRLNAPPPPDLNVDYLNISGTSYTPGQNGGSHSLNSAMTFSGRVRNSSGSTAGASTGRICIRNLATQSDSTCGYYGGSDYTALNNPTAGGNFSVSSLAVGNVGWSPNFTWTPTQTGTYYVYAAADITKGVSETNEGNNTNGVQFTVVAPDLTATLNDPGVQVVNVPFNFTGTENNIGAGTFSQNHSLKVTVRRAGATVGGPSTVFSGGTQPGNPRAFSIEWESNVVGEYEAQACADSNDEVTESDDTPASNCTAWIPFSIANSNADLIAENGDPANDQSYDFDSDPSPSITFEGVLRNTGTGATFVGQNIWGDVEIDWNKGGTCASGAVPDQAFNAGGPWTELANGNTRNLSATLDASDLRNGSHCWRMIADRDNLVAESNNGNNAANPWKRFTISNLSGGSASSDAPSGDIKADGQDSTTISSGSSVDLTWETDDATSCTVSGGGDSWSPDTDNTVGQDTGALTETTIYVLRCSNADHSNVLVDSVTVTVAAAPGGSMVSIDASKKFSKFNEPVDLIWDTGGNLGCVIIGTNGYNSGELAPGTGSDQVRTEGTTTYTLSCPSGGSDAVTVELIPGIWED